MNRITITADKQEVIVSYRPLFRHLIEVDFIKPYEGLKVECATDRNDCNLFDSAQAEAFVKMSVNLLIKQIQNVIKYRKLYQTINDDYKRITDIMWAVLRSLEGISSRDKFQYHCKLQTRVKEELHSRLRTEIAAINTYNEAEYLINPYFLNKILAFV